MSKKPYKQFFHGKDISKTPYKSKPFRWIPFTFIDTYNVKNGHFRSRRKYGADGWAYKDMDTPDNHRPYDHVHDIKNGTRAKPRYPNKQERTELRKAKKKRRTL